jgi:thymidylate synthase (FAD)
MKSELIDHMGSDLTVVNAARVSFDKTSSYDYDYMEQVWRLPQGDAKLIKYLATHNHYTPFTHPQITLRETVPIFVARQRFKHVVGFSYNEVSRRYVDSEPEFYTPEVWRKRAENAKQGSGDNLDHDIMIEAAYRTRMTECLSTYNMLLNRGVCPEQARMVLPQSMMTSYYVTGSLAAFARAYKLRSDSHSQVEIQVLAKEWDRIIRPLFPVSWEALTNV